MLEKYMFSLVGRCFFKSRYEADPIFQKGDKYFLATNVFGKISKFVQLNVNSTEELKKYSFESAAQTLKDKALKIGDLYPFNVRTNGKDIIYYYESTGPEVYSLLADNRVNPLVKNQIIQNVPATDLVRTKIIVDCLDYIYEMFENREVIRNLSSEYIRNYTWESYHPFLFNYLLKHETKRFSGASVFLNYQLRKMLTEKEISYISPKYSRRDSQSAGFGWGKTLKDLRFLLKEAKSLPTISEKKQKVEVLFEKLAKLDNCYNNRSVSKFIIQIVEFCYTDLKFTPRFYLILMPNSANEKLIHVVIRLHLGRSQTVRENIFKELWAMLDESDNGVYVQNILVILKKYQTASDYHKNIDKRLAFFVNLQDFSLMQFVLKDSYLRF